MDVSNYIEGIEALDHLKLARVISLIENEHILAESILLSLKPNQQIPVIGITGPPGAGKSTLVNSISRKLSEEGKRIAILAIDPSSAFHRGALLGDRIRMSQHFNDPNIYIRSMASRGALGGISEKTIEIIDVFRTAPFDIIFIETVGVGQSEIDIVGLADQTIVVLVPESGDDIQHIKSGLMEVGDIYIVNKADREGADTLALKLKKMLKQKGSDIPVLKTVAEKSLGVQNVIQLLSEKFYRKSNVNLSLLTEKALRLILKKHMNNIDKSELKKKLAFSYKDESFNLHRFIKEHY